jgi:hypothetical protein
MKTYMWFVPLMLLAFVFEGCAKSEADEVLKSSGEAGVDGDIPSCTYPPRSVHPYRREPNSTGLLCGVVRKSLPRVVQWTDELH